MCIKRFTDGHTVKALVGKIHDNRGQALTLFGLLIPLLFMFVCVGLDLGWYYLNVSRLQNAADAAVLAGAQELVKDNEKFSNIHSIFLVDSYSGTADSTDISAGNAVAEIYADKNLSGGDDGSVTNSWTNGNVTDIETLYKDDDGKFYYVVYLVENIRHFLMPGWFNDMSAPVVAIAMLSKDATDVPPVANSRTLILDANGGELTDDESEAGTRRTVKENTETDTLLPTKATINLKKHDDTFNEDLLFIGWNTKADGSGTTYGDGKSFTKDELNQLFGTRDTVVLYAQWEHRNIYIAGDSLYNAMKGNSTEGTKGLEELMTYNTWVAIDNLGKSDAYGVYPDGGGSVYNSKGDLFRTETTAINPKNAGEKHNVDATNNFSIFLDLGSDLMYNNNANSSGYGLFKYTWDIGDILNYNSTLDSILAKKNSFVSNNPSLTYNFTNNSSISKADAIKYRVHTIFNLDSVWEVRTNKTTSDKYTAYYKGKGESVPAVPDTDPLYVRIESEELNEADGDRQNTTVRQMFINVNVDNTKETTTTRTFSQFDNYKEVTLGSANGTKYLAKVGEYTDRPPQLVYVGTSYGYKKGRTQYYYKIEDGPYTDYTVGSDGNYYVTETVTPRPMIIFYEGPDRGLTEGVDDSDKNSSQSGSPKEAYPDLSWRDSKPVILNLNADFSGILFAPNSPVAINGNGHNLHGFVVAKEFVRVTTASDYTVSNGKYIDANGKEWFKSSQTNNGITNTVFVDEYGNVDTRPLDNATRPLGSAETLAGIPEDDAINQYKAQHRDMEVVYKLSAFNLGSDSYYDSFDIPELKRNVYTYEDNYQDPDPDKKNSVDMFFTTIRSKWIT